MFESASEGAKSFTVKTVNGNKYVKGCALLSIGEDEKITVVSSLKKGMMRIRVIKNTPDYELISADIIENTTIGGTKEVDKHYPPGDYYFCMYPEKKPEGKMTIEVRSAAQQ